ncbi:MAG: trypsin-like serine protease, partial [Ignavibacteria bacterium]|nr:trypsin-like serine protease [Ignavibacteria bacterium]
KKYNNFVLLHSGNAIKTQQQMMKQAIILIISLFTMTNVQAQLEKSIFAVVKISYNKVGETPVTGGICGSAFLIDDSTIITANHVLNPQNFAPNKGFNFVQYWLLSRDNNLIIPLSKDYIKSIEKIETSIIKIPNRVKCTLEVAGSNPKINDSVQNYGHIINMPITNAHWENNQLIIDDFNLNNSTSDSTGTITEFKKITIDANDVKLKDIEVIQPSFKANIGMSGGPLISNNKIVGMMSFGLPADSDIKDIVFAISIDEILTKLK